jgi:tetratricopeptide (TPR) repeat protein
MKNEGLKDWLQKIAATITALTGFFAGLLGFIQLFQGNASLATLLLLGIGVVLIWLVCLYFARFWRPEQGDKARSAFQPPPTQQQEAAQASKVKRRKWVRWSARFGLVLVPLLVAASYVGWHQVDNLPSQEVVIVVAEFDGPDPQSYRVTETILSQLRDATADYPDVKLKALAEPVTEQMGSEAARDLGEQQKATIMIWGWYGKTDSAVPISINFEVLQPPEYLPEFGDTASGTVQTFALAELDSLQLQTQLSAEMTYLTLFTLGMVSYSAENYTSAIARFDAALEQLPGPTDSLVAVITHFHRGNAYAFNSDYEQAIVAYDTALTIQPSLPEGLYNKGLTLYELGRYEKAIQAYDAALAIKSDYPEALYNKGLALSNLGRYEEAIAAYDAALEIKPDNHKALNNKGSVLLTLSRYEEAIAACNAALEIKPDLPETLNNKGLALSNLGRYEEAIQSYDAAIEIQPNFHQAFHNKGSTLYKLGRYEEAIAAYDTLLAIQPDDPTTLYKEAIAAYDAALAIKPDFPEALHGKGRALHESGRYEEAIAAYDAALDVKPDFYEILHDKGVTLSELGRYEEAIAAYDAALAIKSDYSEALYNKGVTFYELSRYEEALQAYDAALEIKPDFHGALNNKGSTLYELGRYEEALQAYDAALEIKSDKHGTLYNKGRSLYALSRYEEAIAAFTDTSAINPNHPGSYFHIAKAYARLGKSQLALNNLEGLLNLLLLELFSEENSREVRDVFREIVETEAAFDSLRSYPRYKVLMSEVE